MATKAPPQQLTVANPRSSSGDMMRRRPRVLVANGRYMCDPSPKLALNDPKAFRTSTTFTLTIYVTEFFFNPFVFVGRQYRLQRGDSM